MVCLYKSEQRRNRLARRHHQRLCQANPDFLGMQNLKQLSLRLQRKISVTGAKPLRGVWIFFAKFVAKRLDTFRTQTLHKLCVCQRRIFSPHERIIEGKPYRRRKHNDIMTVLQKIVQSRTLFRRRNSLKKLLLPDFSKDYTRRKLHAFCTSKKPSA